MNQQFPYQKLLRNRAISDWKAFKRINSQLQENAKCKKSIAEEIFGILVSLDEQWKKWFIIATNHSRSNVRTKNMVDLLWRQIFKYFENHDKNEAFTKSSFWRRNRIKIILQVLNLDFFLYGDSLRTNFEKEGVVLTIFEGFRRNLALSLANNMLFYGVPILIIGHNPIFLVVLLASVILQTHYSYQRTIKFYYLNEINKIIRQPLTALS